MPFPVSQLLLVVTVSSAVLSAQTAVVQFNETCLFKWIVKSGVKEVHAIRIEWNLRRAGMNESVIRQMSPYILGMMVQDTAAATNLKCCMVGSKKACVGYNPCEQGGVCSFSVERKRNVCLCRFGLQGNLCADDCDECSGECALDHSCHEWATCLNNHGSYSCMCKSGFQGSGSKCADIDECQLSLCSPDATCANSIGSFDCVCNVGYAGNGSVCTDVCECCSNPCQNGGKCVEQVNGYMCKCPVGFEGTLCERRWLYRLEHKHLPVEVATIKDSLLNLTNELAELRKMVISNAEDNCKLYPCHNGGQCIDQRNSYICICVRGFIGRNCSLEAIGLNALNPASSCQHAYSAGHHNSGMFWIKPPQHHAMEVYCDMSAGEGWMRVVDIDAAQTGCPSSLQLESSVPACSLQSAPGCTSVKFHTHLPYSKVRGYTYGRQFWTPDAFNHRQSNVTLDQNYVDGIAITHGPPRRHIWTFAIGTTQDFESANCPCAKHPRASPPSFVSNDFYCDSAFKGPWHSNSRWSSERLWDGHCYSERTCCEREGLPFFVKDLGVSVSDPLEVRLCADQPTSDENVGVEKMELFVL